MHHPLSVMYYHGPPIYLETGAGVVALRGELPMPSVSSPLVLFVGIALEICIGRLPQYTPRISCSVRFRDVLWQR